MKAKAVKQLNLPASPGCYLYYNAEGEVIYVGKAVNLRSRVLSYWRDSANLTPAKKEMVGLIDKIDWIETETEIEALLLEANLIKKYQPYYNVLMRDDKRFLYIHISDDEVPGVFVSRKTNKPGKYFGPFVSGRAVRDTLKALRKIWPYCTNKKIQKRPCFYYQISRCLGPCGEKVSLKEYREKVIRPIILFFEGKKKSIIKNLQKEKKDLTQAGQAEAAERIDFLIKQMEQILKNAKVLSVAEKYQNDVVELAKVLDLPKVPERIEGYDISNIYGQQAVGSMVVFAGGEPDKSGYRKFKIRLEGDAESKKGDVQMLKEMLERRFKNDWPLPDLLIIDGAKAQLNAAKSAIKKAGLDLPVISVAKGGGLRSAIAPDKIYIPGHDKPLVLSLNSPAIHLIKRVRDEAHRFAIKYHRELRSKKLLKK